MGVFDKCCGGGGGRSKTRRIKVTSTSTTTTSTSSGSRDKKRATDSFIAECLEQHNSYRRQHGVGPMTVSREMCAYAQEWADRLANLDKMEHRSEGKYGENISMKWSSDPGFDITGKEPVDQWYDEIKDHVFGKEPSGGGLKSGHFSQVIWTSSVKLGVGKARSKSNKILVVCNYDPPGNFIGQFAEMVPKKK